MKSKRMMMLLGTICMVLMLGLTPLAAACAKPAPTPAEPIVIKAVTFLPYSPPEALGLWTNFEIYMNTVNERAKGELVIEFTGGPEAIPSFEQPMAVKQGVVDMVMIAANMYEGLVPGSGLLGVSELTAEEERHSGAYDLFVEMHKAANFFYLGRSTNTAVPIMHIYSCKKRIETPYDLAGLRLGGMAPEYKSVAEALDMTFISVAFPDRYAAMERGVVDTWIEPLDAMAHYHFFEVVDYCIDLPFCRNMTPFLMNLDKWNSLPEHLQKLMLEAVVAIKPEADRMREECLVVARQEFVDAGVEFIKFSPADTEWYSETIYDAYYERLTELSPEFTSRLIELIRK